jgi:hypothetical protein
VTERGSGPPYRRPAHRAGRLALRALWLIATIPLSIVWFLAVLLLPISKMFIQIPLGLCVFGGFFAALMFGLSKAWGDALQAGLLGLLASLLLGLYTALAERIDPAFGRPTPLPPWWWYV